MNPLSPNPTGGNAFYSAQPPTLIITESTTSDGTNPGHVSGTLASLAANTAATVTYDLGVDWHQYPVVNVGVMSTGPSTGVNIVGILSTDTSNPAVGLVRILNAAASGVFGILASLITTSAGQSSSTVRPQGRYLTISAKNADVVNAQGATSATWIGLYAA